MLTSLLCAQLAIATAAVDSTYTSGSLRDLIARAAVSNHEPPPEFRSYQARIETELSLIVRDTLGRERAAQIEQLAASARWRRMSDYDLHVVGYRSQTIGVPYSALTIVRGWTVPSLYGDRLLLGVAFTQRPSGEAGGQITAIHPLANDRERYYRYAGGDTIAILHTAGRTIPIARIHVTPHADAATPLGLFDGEIDVDAQRAQIVRMRGQFVVLGSREGRPLISRLPGIVAVAYAEFVNAELEGRYWLPTFQRTEFQASVALLGQTRSVFRVVSRFSDFVIDSATGQTAADSMHRPRLLVTYARADSMSHFGDWRQELGVATAGVTADDFDDVGPDAWSSDGTPRFDLLPTKSSEIVRVDRVEGVYTGIAGTLQFRNLVPGLSVGGFGGWAWTEQTLRGGARAIFKRSSWILGARVERALASTNDFALPLEDGVGIGALLGSADDFDYVDRKAVLVSATRAIGGINAALATVQIGVASDHGEVARLTRALVGGPTLRPNRGSTNGSYAIAAAELEVRPNVTGDFVQPGLGGRVRYEAATGQLSWQRVELALSARRYWGPISFAAHADAGALLGEAPPPQALFELGGGETLTGYAYKEFAGDRAALARTYLSYRFPAWRSPVRIFRGVYLPGLSPGLATGAQAGWAELSSDGARRAVAALGAPGSDVPVSRSTDGVRATVGIGISLFSDIVHIGVARPVDRAAPWRFVTGFGQTF